MIPFLSIVVFFLLIIVSMTPINQGLVIKKSNFLKMDGTILYVGGSGSGNYSRIQNAIDNTTINDTIFVYDYSSPYIENIVIDKSINLIGEDKNTTVIDGSDIGDVIFISANFVNITGFTVENSGDVNRDAGIKIQSKNNRISENIIKNNDDGIGISSTSHNIISKNNVFNNKYGIRLYMTSSKNIISENNIFSNKARGIRLESSNNNIIFENKVCNNGNGVRFEDSDYNNFYGNKISNNWIGLNLISSIGSTVNDNIFINDGLDIQDSYKNTILNNSVNGKAIVYLEEESDKIIAEAGQILLVNCENITIKNQKFYNVTYGILLWQTNNSYISDNILYSNDFDGILLHSSNKNIIRKNEISNCENGISIENNGNNNIITENIISNNSYGVHLISSAGNSNISNNKVTDNNYGIQLYDSHDIFVTNNRLSNNYFGISLWQFSSDNLVFSNDIYNCVDGIWLNNANDNQILGNTIIGSEFNGIWLLKSIHNKIAENTVIDCKCSVELTTSNFNLIIENTLVKGGIYVDNSFFNTVTDNIVNNKPLVYLEDRTDLIIDDAGQVILINCDGIKVLNQDFFDLIIGVEIWGCSNCQIINNSFFNNFYSSQFFHSDNNSFSGNKISNYEMWGLFLFMSNDNTFYENHFFLEIKKENILTDFTKRIIHMHFNDFVELSEIQDIDFLFPFILIDSNNDSQAILLISSNRNIILNNNISNNNVGISLESICEKNKIEKNYINSNRYFGIIIDSCDNNLILKNTIKKNGEFGIYFKDSSRNKIKKNIFIENNNSAYFKHSFFNRWINNYWDLPRFLPKPIFGKIIIGSRLVKWINIDWRPAKIPFFL